MANDITSNPWYLDTDTFSYPYRVKIANLNITSATAADHIQIKDKNGKFIVNFTAAAGDLDYRFGNIGWVNGIVITSGGLGTTAIVTINPGAGK